MARVYLQAKKSRYYTAVYINANGKRCFKTTKCANRPDAQRVADAMELGCLAVRERTVVKKHLARFFKDLLRSALGEACPQQTMSQSLHDYVETSKLTKEKKTAQSRNNAAQHLIEFLKKRQSAAPSEQK